MKKKFLVITGVTTSGKSNITNKLLSNNVQFICGDVLQMYQNYPISSNMDTTIENSLLKKKFDIFDTRIIPPTYLNLLKQQ